MSWLILVSPLLLGVAAVWAYDFLEGEWLIADLYDEWHLAHADLSTLDRACAANPNRADVIVSLTTIPSRIERIADTLKSLLRQTRAPKEIRLNIPAFSKRENTAYRIPDWLGALKCVRIVACEDYGPATKLIPTLGEVPANQKILVLDDDRIYPKTLIAEIEDAANKAPQSALALGGWIAPADRIDRPTTLRSNLFQLPPAPVRAVRLSAPRQVDVMQGMAGYLVRPGFFDLRKLTDYSAAPPAAFFVDDVWISAHCAAPKFIIPARRGNFQPKRHWPFYKKTSLGWINRGGGTPETRNNTIILKHFSSVWRTGNG